MKKIIALIMACAMIFALCACGGSSAQNLTFATGGEAGTYYAYGSVLAQFVSNKAGMNITAVVGNGSKANIEDLDAKAAQLAFCQSDVMSYAYSGTNLFEKKVDSFSAVAALYMEDVQIITLNPNIKTVADLKGKKVSVGASGSGTYFNAVDALKAYDMTIDDIDPQYLSFGDSTEAMKDNKIDAAFIVAGAPTTAVTDLSVGNSVYVVSIDDAHIDKLISMSPYYSKHVIPKGTYNGMTEDATTVAVAAVVLARNDVSEDTIYNFVKTIFENSSAIKDQHAKGADLDPAFASYIKDVPYHPGAVKYYTEKGITVG